MTWFGFLDEREAGSKVGLFIDIYYGHFLTYIEKYYISFSMQHHFDRQLRLSCPRNALNDTRCWPRWNRNTIKEEPAYDNEPFDFLTYFNNSYTDFIE